VNAPAGAQPAAAPEQQEKSERIAARARSKEQARERERAARRAAALEREIGELEERLALLTAQLGEPDVYRDGELVRAIEADRSELSAELARLYPEWEQALLVAEPPA
jgi:hypothetical protein